MSRRSSGDARIYRFSDYHKPHSARRSRSRVARDCVSAGESQDEAVKAAAAFHTWLESGSDDARRQHDFERWLAARPQHRRVFYRINRMWHLVGLVLRAAERVDVRERPAQFGLNEPSCAVAPLKSSCE